MTTHDAITSIVQRLAAVPVGADVSLVIRHAEREDIPAGTFGHIRARCFLDWGMVSQPRKGWARLCRKEGRSVSYPARYHVASRPRRRSCAAQGRRLRPQPIADWVMKGPFVVEPNVSGPLFLELPISEIARRQLQDADPQPGMRPTAEGVEILLNLTTGNLGEGGRLDIFVTHDVILAVLVASIIGPPLEKVGWPGYLEGLFLWRSRTRLRASWRGFHQTSPYPLGG